MPLTPDPTGDFFRELGARANEPLLRSTSGTLRFDFPDGGRVERWYVTLEKGDVKVSHKNVKADAVLSGDKQLFERIASGRENAMAAFLRGAIAVQGDISLMLRFSRIFPAPPSSFVPPADDTRRAR